MTMDITAALPTFLVTLREGVEAALVVGIVLAYLKKAGRQHLNSWVFGGIGAGILASVFIGVGFVSLLNAVQASNQDYAPVIQQVLEAGFGVVAIALLSWMLVWMTRQAKSLKGEIESTISEALLQHGGAGWGVFGLVAIAVLREGFETVIFIAAQFQDGWVPAVGAIAGLLVAVAIGYMLFQLGIKINLKRFFQIMGVLLLLIVSGLVVSALRHVDLALSLLSQLRPDYDLCFSAGSCVLGPMVWDASQVLPDRQFPGILLKSLFGYRDTLYVGQAIGYLVFLLSVGSLYWRSIAGVGAPKPSNAPTQSTSMVPEATD